MPKLLHARAPKMELKSNDSASWPTAVTLQAIGLCALG